MSFRLIRELRSSIECHDASDPDQSRWELNIDGLKLTIQDTRGSKTCEAVFREIVRNELGLVDIQLSKGDVVVDIGANVGIPSIYLAKKFPEATFHLFEPVPENFRNLVKNIEVNKVSNVHAQNMAITSDGRDYPMNVILEKNSGGATGLSVNLVEDPHFSGYLRAQSTTLDHVFESQDIKTCALLKIDCEGAEHEILNSFSRWQQLTRLIAEIHLNSLLEAKGHSFEKTEALIHQLGEGNYKLKRIRMSE